MELNRHIIDETMFVLFERTAKYSRSFNYDELKKGWKDKRKCPTENEIIDCWNSLQKQKELKYAQYYKLSNKKWILDQDKKEDLKQAIIKIYDKEAASNFQDNFISISLGMENIENEKDFSSNLFKELKLKSEENKERKNALENMTMTKLIEIYENLKAEN